MKKGITPIVATIIMLLITIALAGAAWTFLSGYFTSMTSQTIQVVGSSCAGTNTVKMVVRNMGTQTITLGCVGAAAFPAATSVTCGSMTIIKATGGNLAGGLDVGSIAPNTNVVITDTSCANPTICKYSIVTSGAGTPSGTGAEVSVGPCP
jgi:flagellin-like protein